MKILIDADGCPVVDKTVSCARMYDIKCVIVCDTSHVFEKDGADTVTVSKGADSADFALVNMTDKGDVVITQDYGLAAMCLAKGAVALRDDGMQYTDANIGSLLSFRHEAKKIMRAGKHLKGKSKRTDEQDKAFKTKLTEIIKTIQKGSEDK